jgi:hypothetical protein
LGPDDVVLRLALVVVAVVVVAVAPDRTVAEQAGGGDHLKEWVSFPSTVIKKLNFRFKKLEF